MCAVGFAMCNVQYLCNDVLCATMCDNVQVAMAVAVAVADAVVVCCGHGCGYGCLKQSPTLMQLLTLVVDAVADADQGISINR